MQEESLEPITIVRTQYKGTGERYYWAAFYHRASLIPWFMGLDADLERKFFEGSEASCFIYGLATTPGHAVVKMYKNLRKR